MASLRAHPAARRCGLLIEASNELTLMEPAEEPIGEPMEVIKAGRRNTPDRWAAAAAIQRVLGRCPARPRRGPAPPAAAIDARTVKRNGRKLDADLSCLRTPMGVSLMTPEQAQTRAVARRWTCGDDGCRSATAVAIEIATLLT